VNFCPNCGQRVNPDDVECEACECPLLSAEDIARVAQAARGEHQSAGQSEAHAKQSFLDWLREVGLSGLVVAFFNWTWQAIRAIFGF